VEGALQKHFTALDGLIETAVIETNQPAHLGFPKSALAGKVWTVPALGDEVKRSGEELQTTLHGTLGEQRWPLVEAQLEANGTHTLRRVLNLDAGQKSQELGAWLREENGRLLVGYGWSSGYTSFSSGGVALDQFLPNPPSPGDGAPGGDPLEFLGSQDFPGPLTRRLKDWLQTEAVQRLGKEANR
jgi:hypothetical protein